MLSLTSLAGTLALVYITASIFYWVYKNFVAKGIPLSKYVSHRSDNWAVVTGASRGIGLGYAEVLAKHGANVVLISRSEKKLKELAESFESNYKVKTMVIAADFSSPSVWDDIKQKLEKLNVTILVNNVGVNTEYPKEFLDISEAELQSQVDVNIKTTMQMTRIILPNMVENGRGFILNLASFTGIFPTPMLSVYGATKAFITNWTEALATEYKSKGIEFMNVCPFYVVSEMSGFRRTSFMVCDGQRLASDTFDKIGVAATMNPYWPHDFLTKILNFVPTSILRSKMYGQMKSVQKRLLRKKERKKKGE